MKYILWIFIVTLLMSACGVPAGGATGPSAALTPYFYAVTTTTQPEMAAAEVTATATIAPTPPPQIHVVGLGETISSIAVKYGVSIDSILAANPAIDPRVMIVGDEVLIPGITAAEELAPAYTDQIFLAEPHCAQSGGGLWCSVMLRNTSAVDLEYPVIAFSFEDSADEMLLVVRPATVLRVFSAGTEMPVFVFLEETPANYASVSVSLFAIAEPAGEVPNFNVVLSNQSIEIENLSATFSGQILIEGENSQDRADLTIAAVALDASGSVVGVRHETRTVAVNEGFDYSISVYSTDGAIDDVILYTEAY